MLVGAREQDRQAAAPARRCSKSDALSLPIRDGSLDLISVAFGFRNLANYEAGLREMRRVLRPGGMAAILEFSQPRNAVFGAVYQFYSRRILPCDRRGLDRLAGCVYLPAGVDPQVSRAPEQLADDMRRAGFGEVRLRVT